MSDEVRIVAVFDDTDVANGVRRTERAAREMKQVWETTTWLGTPGAGGAGAGQGAGPWDPSQFEKAGAEAGSSWTRGFLGKLLIRDAIYATLRGISDAIKETTDDLQKLAGVKPTSLSAWQEFTHWIGDNLAFAISSIFPGFKAASKDLAEANLRNVRLENKDDEDLARFRDDPNELKQSVHGLMDRLAAQVKELADAKEANAKEHVIGAETGDAHYADKSDQELQETERHAQHEITYTRELISLAKERDRQNAEHATKKQERDDKAAHSVLEANQFMRDQERAEKARADRQDLRIEKNHEEHALADQAAADRAQHKPDETDLRFTERELHHQRATEVVSIDGGLYGRNSSAASLVQHAAQQVSLLRSINTNLEAIRKERSELTLA